MCAPDIQKIYNQTSEWKIPKVPKETSDNKKIQAQKPKLSVIVTGTPPPPRGSSLDLRFNIQR